jgi:hypothetical protein
MARAGHPCVCTWHRVRWHDGDRTPTVATVHVRPQPYPHAKPLDEAKVPFCSLSSCPRSDRALYFPHRSGLLVAPLPTGTSCLPRASTSSTTATSFGVLVLEPPSAARKPWSAVAPSASSVVGAPSPSSAGFGHRPDQRPCPWAPPTPHGARRPYPWCLWPPLRTATMSFTGRVVRHRGCASQVSLSTPPPSPGAQIEYLASPWSSPTHSPAWPHRRSPELTAAAAPSHGSASAILARGPPTQLVWAWAEAALDEQYIFSFSKDIIQINSNNFKTLWNS